MSFGGKAQVPTAPPKPAGLDNDDFASNEQAVPVPWHIGARPAPLTWVVDKVYNQRTVEIRSKAGKGKETVNGYEYYGDVAGIAGLGLARELFAIEADNEVIWTGSIYRPENPAHPDYWRTHVVTSAGDLYFYWGRPDQPMDDLLLAGLGAADATLAHPAYRHQVLVVLQNFRLQDSGTVPNVRVFFTRVAQPELGAFAAQDSTGGESMVAGVLELLTNPIFGAGLPVARFTAAEWEALSAAVIARVGCHSPFLDRARPVRDVVKDFQLYYDGWCRIENGKIRPGYFPHDGSVPGGLTELSVHDFTERPRTNAGAPSETVNDVTVVYRDGSDFFKKKPASDSDSANVEARRSHESRVIQMPGIITFAQAQAFAAEAAATGAEGEWEGEVRVRPPRAVWADGSPLRAGDNIHLDLIEPEVDQVSRIVKRTDFYDQPPRLQIKAEPGVYPASYVPPADLRPDIGRVLPTEITAARILELTPDLAGTPLGLPVAFLAKRPPSGFEGVALPGANVQGFNAWYGGTTGASYDIIGNAGGWALRGVVRETIASGAADLTVKLTLDADNLDLARLAAQTAQGQLNDNLLVVIGTELFSVGAIALAGYAYDLTCKRVRLGSLPAAHALGAEAWLVWRDELRVFLHKGFVEDADRYFKLQPFTQTAVLELADADPILYHFRDRAPERPVIVINALAGALRTGVPYNITGSISDVNGDLTTYEIAATKYTAPGGAISSEFTLKSAELPPADRALFNFKVPFSFPLPGTWRIRVKAYDATGAFATAQTAELTVAQSTTVDDVAALIDAVNLLMAQLVADTQQQADDLLAEVAAREQAIIDEAYERNTADTSITGSLDALTSEYNSNKSVVAGQITALTDADSAQAISISTLFTQMGDANSQISTLITAISNETDTRASQVTSLQSQIDGVDSTVDIMAAAYIVGGTAIATWGLKLDANSKVVGMQAIAASGGTQADTGVIVFSGADLRTDNYVADTSGWFLGYGGEVDFQGGNFRGSVKLGFASMVLNEGQGSEGGQLNFEMQPGGSDFWACDVYNDGAFRIFHEGSTGNRIDLLASDVSCYGSLHIGTYGYGDFATYSSGEFKSNVTPMESVLAKARNITAKRYAYNDRAPGKTEGQTDIGWIAEEIEPQFPELVVRDDQGRSAILYGKAVVFAFHALNEQQDIIEAQGQQIASLQMQLDMLLLKQVA